MSESPSSSQASSRSTSPDVSISDLGYYQGSVIDIGGSKLTDTMATDLKQKFICNQGNSHKHRVIPSSVFHNEAGLRMWAQITNMPDYYQTRDEVGLLEQNSRELTRQLAHAWTLLDLGCGDVKKVMPLLEAFEAKQMPVQYFALDLSRSVLVESMRQLRPRFRYVHCYGLWGTFDDCLAWVKTIQSPKCYMSLGSMFGNDHFEPAVQRLKAWTDIMRPQDRMLLGLDATSDHNIVWKSYHDEAGLFRNFIENGLLHSNVVLDHTWYNAQDWEITGELQDSPLMHHFIIRALKDVKCDKLGLFFHKGETIICYEGFKYGPAAMQKQFAAAGLKKLQQWKSPTGSIYQYLLCRASMASFAQDDKSANRRTSNH